MYNILCNYFKFKYLKGCVSAACFFRPLQPPLLLQLEPLCCESVCVPFFLCGLQTSTFGARCLWQADEADTQTAMSMCWMSLQYKNNKTAVTQPLMGLWGQSKQWLILIIQSTSFIPTVQVFWVHAHNDGELWDEPFKGRKKGKLLQLFGMSGGSDMPTDYHRGARKELPRITEKQESLERRQEEIKHHIWLGCHFAVDPKLHQNL